MRKYILLVVFSLALFGCKWAEPKSVGIYKDEQGESLHACPDKPNCVSSHDTNKKSFAEPIPVPEQMGTKQALALTKSTLLGMPNVKLRHEKGNYFWFEFRTKMGFVDDVELLYVPEKHEFLFRSASRLGYYDFNVNRTRYNKIRKVLQGEYDEEMDAAGFNDDADTNAG